MSLVQKTADLSCFKTSFLAAGENLAQVRLQLSRWVQQGKVVKINKGLYSLAEPYRKRKPDLFVIANGLRSVSYISLQSALAWYGMIPEFVPEVSSVTSGRPALVETPLGRFSFRYIKKNRFNGYVQKISQSGEPFFIALPEKALLDLVYLVSGGETVEYLTELRLQNLEKLDLETLQQIAIGMESLKIMRAVDTIKTIVSEGEGFEL